MQKIYYTFQVLRHSGIGDQVGAQFSHLYTLGHQCGWVYVHLTPFDFDRRTPGRQSDKGLSSIAEYLGLACTDPKPCVNLETTILLSRLIEDASSIQDVRNRLKHFVGKHIGISEIDAGINSSILVNIEVVGNYGGLIPLIQRLTGMNWEKTLHFAGATYLQAKRPSLVSRFENSPIAVAHIRIGDSVRIDTESCPVILHGDKVYTSLARYQQEIGPSDPSRVSKIAFRPFDMLETVKTLIQASCIQPARLYLVSDGFSATRRCILSYIWHRQLSLNIGILALRKISEYERMLANAMRWVPLSQRIIGEEPHKTLSSIELFANASLVMCNTGGFSNAIFNIYNPNCSVRDSFIWL